MNPFRWTALVAGLLTIVAAPILWAADTERELALTASIKQGVHIGQVVELKAPSGDFIGIETEADPDLSHKGAVLILHGMGNNPNSDDLIRPVRSGLPKHGWSTLAIQMPLAADEAPPADYWPLIAESSERIDAALSWLKSQKPPRIVLLGHGLGAVMATHYLSQKPDSTDISALITIGLPVPDSETPEAQTLAQLEKLKLPTLDLYGSQDLRNVTETAKQRRLAAKKGDNPAYRQTRWMGADHSFSGLEESLIQQLNGWLSKQPIQP